MEDKVLKRGVKVFARSDKYREGWDRIFGHPKYKLKYFEEKTGSKPFQWTTVGYKLTKG